MGNNKQDYIAFFCPQIYPCSIGGLEIYNYYLVKEVSKHKNVILFTECKSVDISNIQMLKIWSRIFIIRRFYLGALSGLLSLMFHIIALKFSKINIEVILVSHTSNAASLGLIFPFIKFLFKIDYVITLHGGGMKSWRKYSLHSLLFKHSTKVIAVSEPMRREFSKRIESPITVIPSLIPFHKSTYSKDYLKDKYGFNKESTIILMVGSIKPLKGNDLALNAFRMLGINYIQSKKLYLVFAGKGPSEGNLSEMAIMHDIQSRVRFLGELPNEKVHEIYAMADIYVTASWYESLSKTMLEAMSNALPIVASDNPGIKYSISDGNNGLLFKNKSVHDLSEKLKYLIDNPDYAKKLGINAKRDFEKSYDFQDNCNKLMDLYSSI